MDNWIVLEKDMKKKQNKEKTQREKTDFPNLNARVNIKRRAELLDYDYLDKLNDEELAFLDKFNKEYIIASLAENNEDNLHNTPELKKDCYDRNNARNRDILTKEKAKNSLLYLEELISEETKNPEDELIKKLDDDVNDRNN